MPAAANMFSVLPPGNGQSTFVTLSTRHNGKSNQCFADGHIELFDPTLLQDDTVTDLNQSAAFQRYVLLMSDW